jgi:hypothetical protein
MKSTLLALALGLWIAGGSFFGGADEIQVVSLTRDGVVYVSCTFPDGFSHDMREALRSGLQTAITYDIELRKEVPVWFDRTLTSVTVTASAQYDSLTRQHQLSRTIDGRGEEPRVTADEEEVRAWLTSLERLRLFRTTGLEPNTDYYIQVRAHSKPRTNWFLFWPFDRGTATGSVRFTFIPS